MYDEKLKFGDYFLDNTNSKIEKICENFQEYARKYFSGVEAYDPDLNVFREFIMNTCNENLAKKIIEDIDIWVKGVEL